MTAPGTPSVPATGWWVKRSIVLFPEAFLALTGQIPGIVPGAGGAPIAGALTLIGSTPSINRALTPIPAALVISRYEPTLKPTVILRPAPVTFTATGSAPAVLISQKLTPTAGALVLIGGGGSTDGGNAASAGTGTVDGGDSAGTGSGGIDGGHA